MPSYVNSLVIQFSAELKPYEVPAFRGAVINAIGDKADILFHNHKEEGLRYAYPLIQYKRIGGKASIVCINAGTEAIGQFFSNMKLELNIGDHITPIQVCSIRPHQTLVQVWDNAFCYHLRNWLPLNEENYRQYTEQTSLTERVSLLERILIGNILSFAKGVGVDIARQIRCSIMDIEGTRLIKVKGNRLMSFDVMFKTNVSLPDFIGLGKHTSFGHGIVCQCRDKEGKQNDTTIQQ